jgi:hypothetical protein
MRSQGTDAPKLCATAVRAGRRSLELGETCAAPPRSASLQQVLEPLVYPIRRRLVRELFAARQDMSCEAIDLQVCALTAQHRFPYRGRQS